MIGPRWSYEDATGVQREGVYAGSHEGQGTDVTYLFRRDDGRIDCVSGARLKRAKRIVSESKPKTEVPE